MYLIVLVIAASAHMHCAWAADSPNSSTAAAFPSYDGSGHNSQHPDWGKTGTPFAHGQVLERDHMHNSTNGFDVLAGANRPSPRAITLALLHKPYFKSISDTNGSMLTAAIGQLISQDINRAGVSTESAPIIVPPGDPYMARFANQTPVAQAGRTTLPYFRSSYDRSTPNGSREHVNEASAWIDGSSIYGETAEIAKAIRAGTAGRLLVGEDRLLPLNLDPKTGQPYHKMKNAGQRLPQTQLRLSGNPAVNQNPLLMSITTVFVREHNRRALLVEAAHPEWSDEQIYQEARKWVIGHLQRVALVEYMAAIGLVLPPYKGYNATTDPAIDTFFSVVAYRYGHATINDVVLRLDDAWTEHHNGHLNLADTFYNPTVALSAGLEPLLRGMIAQTKGKVEPRWSLAMAGNFAGHAGINGSDVAATNIQRGRDHGVPDYNSCRRAFGLPPVSNFSEISPDPQVAAVLQELYGNVDNIDPYVGGLAEAPQGRAHMGPLFVASITEQFIRLRDADWWYFENGANNKLYTDAEIEEIKSTSLRDMILRSTNISDLPSNIWIATAGTQGMTCAAQTDGSSSSSIGTKSVAGAGGTGSAGNKLRLSSPLGGTVMLQIEPGSQAGWVKVSLASAGEGWLGFGVADPGSPSPMVGADMVIGLVVDASPQVLRYKSTGHEPPNAQPAEAQASRLKVIRFEQSGGNVHLEFERPTDSSGSERAMPTNQPLRLIIARGPSNDISSLQGYHGTSNREVIELSDGLFGASVTTSTAKPSMAVMLRQTHGILMAVNFIVVFPLGALAARQLRCHWLRSPVIRAAMFYVHVFTQVSGVAIATAGFVLALNWFQVPYSQVRFSHGKLGIAILVLVYLQMFVGFVRPHAGSPTSRRRHIWDVVHTTLGRAAMLIGLANVSLGIVIFCFTYGGNFSVWAGLCAAGLGALSLTQAVIDRQEKYAVLNNDRKQAELMDAHLKRIERGSDGGEDSSGQGSRWQKDVAADGGGPSSAEHDVSIELMRVGQNS